VNLNPLKPVIGVRSFGGDPSLVSGMVAAQVQGYQDSGIASTAKHFPGHGDTNVDSHTVSRSSTTPAPSGSRSTPRRSAPRWTAGSMPS
jgi:beta-glucosidase-like glycosyl hydrolase